MASCAMADPDEVPRGTHTMHEQFAARIAQMCLLRCGAGWTQRSCTAPRVLHRNRQSRATRGCGPNRAGARPGLEQRSVRRNLDRLAHAAPVWSAIAAYAASSARVVLRVSNSALSRPGPRGKSAGGQARRDRRQARRLSRRRNRRRAPRVPAADCVRKALAHARGERVAREVSTGQPATGRRCRWCARCMARCRGTGRHAGRDPGTRRSGVRRRRSGVVRRCPRGHLALEVRHRGSLSRRARATARCPEHDGESWPTRPSTRAAASRSR